MADLHRRSFHSDGSEAEYQRFFSDVFLNGPGADSTISSLVYEETDGTIAGFQGVQTWRMLFAGKPLTAAVLSHYAVDPGRRGVGAVRLLKQCLEGPQDLSLCDESGDGVRKMFEWCGGRTALLYSMHWVRPLQPSSALLALWLSKRSPILARLGAPFARAVDAGCRLGGPLKSVRPRGSRHLLDEALMAERLPQFTGHLSLRPDYADGSLQWRLRRAMSLNGGSLKKVLVKGERNKIAGWFLYYAKPGDVAEVLQIAASRETIGLVLDHLIEDASLSGSVALKGRLDPSFAQELSDRFFIFYRRGHWTLIHSRRPELLQAIDRGDAFLSRLEGEWCLHFR